MTLSPNKLMATATLPKPTILGHSCRIPISRGAKPEGFKNIPQYQLCFALRCPLPERATFVFKSRSSSGFSLGRCLKLCLNLNSGVMTAPGHTQASNLPILSYLPGFRSSPACGASCLSHTGDTNGEDGVSLVIHLSYGCPQSSGSLTYVKCEQDQAETQPLCPPPTLEAFWYHLQESIPKQFSPQDNKKTLLHLQAHFGCPKLQETCSSPAKPR